ncbi:hypothetical protein D3C81_1680130 [compost metagenome]
MIATTAAIASFENGFSQGPQEAMTLPLLHWFNSMPTSDGTTIIQNRLVIIAAASSCTLAPTSSDRIPGTTNGASSVSIRLIDKVKAMLPL